MPAQQELRERLERATSLSLQNWQVATGPTVKSMAQNVEVDMGWGRILFGPHISIGRKIVSSAVSGGRR